MLTAGARSGGGGGRAAAAAGPTSHVTSSLGRMVTAPRPPSSRCSTGAILEPQLSEPIQKKWPVWLAFRAASSTRLWGHAPAQPSRVCPWTPPLPFPRAHSCPQPVPGSPVLTHREPGPTATPAPTPGLPGPRFPAALTHPCPQAHGCPPTLHLYTCLCPGPQLPSGPVWSPRPIPAPGATSVPAKTMPVSGWTCPVSDSWVPRNTSAQALSSSGGPQAHTPGPCSSISTVTHTPNTCPLCTPPSCAKSPGASKMLPTALTDGGKGAGSRPPPPPRPQ